MGPTCGLFELSLKGGRVCLSQEMGLGELHQRRFHLTKLRGWVALKKCKLGSIVTGVLSLSLSLPPPPRYPFQTSNTRNRGFVDPEPQVFSVHTDWGWGLGGGGKK